MLKRTPSQKKIMLKVQLVDVVFSQEVTFNVAITPAGEVEGTVEVPISELERLSQWKEVNWRNLLFVYEKEMTWSSRCQGVIQMREPLSPHGIARITVWQLHDDMAGYAGPLSSVDPLCLDLCPSLACNELVTLFDQLGLLSSSPHIMGDPILPPVGNRRVTIATPPPPPPPPPPPLAAGVGGGADDHVNPQQQQQAPPPPPPAAVAPQPIWQVLQVGLAVKLLFFYLICQRNRHLTSTNKQGILLICCFFYFYRVGVLNGLIRYLFGRAAGHAQQQQEEVVVPRRNLMDDMWQMIMRLLRQGPVLPRGPGVIQDAQAIVTAFLSSLFPNWQIELAPPPPPPPPPLPEQPQARRLPPQVR